MKAYSILSFIFASILYSLFLSSAAKSQSIAIRYVTTTGTAPSSATSWAASTSDLQGAINSLTVAGGQVWVAAGLYKPGGNSNIDRAVSFSIASGVEVYGGFAGTEMNLSERPLIHPSSTTLSGDIGQLDNRNDNSYHVVVMGNFSSTGSSSHLDGVVVTAGMADGGSPGNGDPLNTGGGLLAIGRPILTNCSFINNVASINGGGVGALTDSITVINCSFSGNRAYAYGGAFYTTASPTRLINCSFLNNATAVSGGGVCTFGGALVGINCSFSGNTSELGGGASTVAGRVTLTNCVLWNNGETKSLAGSTISYSAFDSSVLAGRYVTDGGNNRILSYLPFISETDLRLNACSPAINGGIDKVNPTLSDGLGNNRVVDNKIDMGAFEFQSIPLNMYTLTSGSWNDSTIWSCGRIPLPSDPVRIKHMVSLPDHYQARALQITFEAGQQLLFGTDSRLLTGQ